MSGKDFSEFLDVLEMSLNETISYVLFKNPVSSTVIDSVKGVANATIFKPMSTSPSTKLPSAIENLQVQRLVYTGHPFVRLAGISGATAILLGAYGEHSFQKNLHKEHGVGEAHINDHLEEFFSGDASLKDEEVIKKRKKIYETANSYHLIHSLALLGVPLAKRPIVAGSLITLGTVLFCGTCYYDAFTNNKSLRRLTPIGGVCLIIGWLCFVF